jgi:hypothetical protein
MATIKVTVNRSGSDCPRSIGTHSLEVHHFHDISISSTGGDAFARVVQFAIDESGREDQAHLAFLCLGYLLGKFQTSQSFTFSGDNAFIRIEVV